MTGYRQIWRRFWRGLPHDGLGWAGGAEPALSAMRCAAARDWRRNFAGVLRPGLWLADRAMWPLAALQRSTAFADALDLTASARWRLYRDCLLTGGQPVDVHAWRSLHGSRHPLPARSAGLVLRGLGDPAGHVLLADKLATAEHLASAGCAFPALHGMCRRGEGGQPAALAAIYGAGSDLFIKPRHGHGGRGAFALLRHSDGLWADGQPMTASIIRHRLDVLSRGDDLLFQERLMADPDIADLAADGRAPVLRLTTARCPGEAPFLHAALLTMAVPGRSPSHFLNGAIHAPVDRASGRLAAGMSLAAPGDRLERLIWNGAPLNGRAVPGFAAAVALSLRAMAALPPLPLVNWDVVPTATGPVLLEGNSAGNWTITSLPGVYGLDSGPLAPLLVRWQRQP